MEINTTQVRGRALMTCRALDLGQEQQQEEEETTESDEEEPEAWEDAPTWPGRSQPMPQTPQDTGELHPARIA
jgi:hypothetical protein